MAMEGMMEGLSACECPVCFLLLSEKRLPMSMPCGHTLCQVCVGLLADKATATSNTLGQKPQPTFSCPLCRQWINAASVKLNVTLRDLLGELSRLNQPRTLAVGTHLNVNYEEIVFLGMLDRGAFGEVHQARWRGDEMAVKVFVSGQLTPEAMQAFQREVFVMNCLRHPNVVLLMGACQTPPRLAILMEFIPGGSLHKLIHINKVHLPLPHLAQLGTDICRGLQYLHSINILHRDLKSKNVLLTSAPPCQAKLCDFGLARMRQESATMTGNVGTVHWTAPEILNNQRYQFPADIYSFGMVLYEMAYWKFPFQNMLPMAVMMAVVINRQRPGIPSDAHPELADLIRNCTHWNPAERLSVAHVLSALSELLPPVPQQEKGGVASGGRPPLMHQDSLGVVFVEAADTTDLQEQDTGLQQLLRANQPNQSNPLNQSPEVEEPQLLSEAGPHAGVIVTGRFDQSELSDQQMSDYELALRVQEETRRQQELSDFELAEQLQIRENTFLAPKQDASSSKQPPQPLLDSIKSGTASVLKPLKKQKTKKGATKMAAAQEFESVEAKRETKLAAIKSSILGAPHLTKSTLPHPPPISAAAARKTPPSPLSKKKTAASPPSPSPKNTAAPSTSKTATALSSFLLKKKAAASPPSSRKTAVSSAKLPQPPTSASKQMSPRSVEPPTTKSIFSKKKAKSKAVASSAVTTSSPPPPPPPPPPPTLPSHRKHPIMSPRQHMMAQVRRSAGAVASKLKHVETVEKRPFRVGRVVDGYNAEHSQYTFQNLLTTFNRKFLHRVDVVEPLPVFPVGRVVDTRRNQGNRVKRMSSFIDTQLSVSSTSSDSASPLGIPALPPPPRPPPPRRRLHKSIAAAIEHFSLSKLQHVEPVVKMTLPDATTIALERAMSMEDDDSVAVASGYGNEEAFSEPAGYLQLGLTPPKSAEKEELHRYRLMEKFASLWWNKTFRGSSKVPDEKEVCRLQLMEKYATLWLNKTRSALQQAEANHVRALQSSANMEIERFDRSRLEHVEPVVKQILPDSTRLAWERGRRPTWEQAIPQERAVAEKRWLSAGGQQQMPPALQSRVQHGLQKAEPRQVEPVTSTQPDSKTAALTVKRDSLPVPVLVREPSIPVGLEEIDVLDLLPAGRGHSPQRDQQGRGASSARLSGEWGSDDETQGTSPKCVAS